MTHIYNAFGQPIGRPLPDWAPAAWPERRVLTGRYCRLEPLDLEMHGKPLFAAYAQAPDARDWTYLPAGPFDGEADFLAWLDKNMRSDDPLFFAIVSQASGQAVGLASYLRIEPAQGCIEVGHLHFSRLMQRSPMSTEAMWLMMRYAFSLGYRRYEWKCDALNAPSRTAALRLGFSFEGIFRQARVVKGRSRDTAWFSILDEEWPALNTAFEAWLSPENFDGAGVQRQRLPVLIAQQRPPA